MKIRQIMIAMGLGLGAAASVQAQTVTGNMAVSATISGTCTVTANPLSFSVYDPAATSATQVNTTIVIGCTSGAGTQLAMGNGLNSTGTGTTVQRRLRVGATSNYLNYSIFQPSSTAEAAACAYTTQWGPGGAGNHAALAIGAAPSNANRTYNVCGQIPALQSQPAGSYVDTVVVTATL